MIHIEILLYLSLESEISNTILFKSRTKVMFELDKFISIMHGYCHSCMPSLRTIKMYSSQTFWLIKDMLPSAE